MAEELPNKLIPQMREGVEVVKMITFKKLRGQLSLKHHDRDGVFLSRLTGAVINQLFGTPNDQEPFATFTTTYRALIDAELETLAKSLPEMLIPLTDALRMQTLCDLQEGQDSSGLLEQARDLNLLLSDRELPLPNSFMELARKLGAAFGLIIPPLPTADSPDTAAN